MSIFSFTLYYIKLNWYIKCTTARDNKDIKETRLHGERIMKKTLFYIGIIIFSFSLLSLTFSLFFAHTIYYKTLFFLNGLVVIFGTNIFLYDIRDKKISSIISIILISFFSMIAIKYFFMSSANLDDTYIFLFILGFLIFTMAQLIFSVRKRNIIR